MNESKCSPIPNGSELARIRCRSSARAPASSNSRSSSTRLGEPADAREYGAAAAILLDLGVSRAQVLTNNPGKLRDREAGFPSR
ncbi:MULTISPECIES: hypothetical protein [Actinomycetes]|uniref:hypothetical protein n=1 Tax=Actinomycetes TaxID=1760 RepID=UPI0001B53FE8|nr:MULTISPECIES: hypothetical protein [Actinomycetes]